MGVVQSQLGNLVAVSGEDFPRIFDFVDHTLTAGLHGGPQFQVLDSVVVSHPVAVVDILVSSQGSAKEFGHDDSMLRAVATENDVTLGCDISSGAFLGRQDLEWVAMGAPSGVVDSTPTKCHDPAVASVDGANLRLSHTSICRTCVEKTAVVHRTEATSAGDLLASLDRADLGAERLASQFGFSGLAILAPTSEMGRAPTPGHDGPPAPVNGADLGSYGCHGMVNSPDRNVGSRVTILCPSDVMSPTPSATVGRASAPFDAAYLHLSSLAEAA